MMIIIILVSIDLAEHSGLTQQIKSNVGVRWKGKTEVPRQKPLWTEKRTNKLSPHMMAGQTKSNSCHIGRRRVLSALW